MRQVVAYKRLKQWKILHYQAQKVVTVDYRKWLLTRGSKCKALTRKILKLWIVCRLREVVACGGSTVYADLKKLHLKMAFKRSQVRNIAKLTWESSHLETM